MTESPASPEVVAELQDIATRAELVAVTLIESHVLVHQFFEGLLNIANDIGGGTAVEDGAGLAVRLDFRLRATRADTEEGVYDLNCSFLSRYKITLDHPPSVEALELFTSTTGMLSMYPYAREYIQSETVRMGMTGVVLPVFRVAWPVATDVGGPVKRRSRNASSPARRPVQKP